MQIILEPGVTFDGYWIDYIVEETKRLIHGEFKEHFDNLPDTLENKHLMFCMTDDLLMFCKDKVINLEKVDSATVADAYTSFKQVNSNAIFRAEFFGESDNDIFQLTYIGLTINVSTLNMFIVREFERIDLMKEFLSLTIRHELGHIIDFLSYHGKPIDDVLKIRKQYEDEKEAFYKSWEGQPFSKELSFKYQELEEEAVANTNGNVDVKRSHEVEELMAATHKDCSIVLNIDMEVKDK